MLIDPLGVLAFGVLVVVDDFSSNTGYSNLKSFWEPKTQNPTVNYENNVLDFGQCSLYLPHNSAIFDTN
jgi:hypothetical protein